MLSWPYNPCTQFWTLESFSVLVEWFLFADDLYCKNYFLYTLLQGLWPLKFLKLFATLCVLLLLVLQHLMWNGLHCTPQLSWYFYIESAEDKSCSCAMFYAWCKIMTCFHNFLFSMMLYNISDFGDQISLMIDYIRFCRWKLCCALPQAFMLNF